MELVAERIKKSLRLYKVPQKNCENQTFTYQTRPAVDSHADSILLSMATLLSRVQHNLYADLCKGKTASELKSSYLQIYKITARHFNAIRVQLEGKIASITEIQKLQIKDDKQRISSLEKKIKLLQKRSSNTKLIHLKKRRLATLQSRLQKKEEDQKLGKTHLCFGSRKLFRKQFSLEANNYSSHSEWKKEWTDAREQSFFLIGSKDETAGNQSCVATFDGKTFSLKIRLPDALSEYGKYLVIPNVSFSYGHEAIVAALMSHLDADTKKSAVAISYRFLRDKKGWRVFLSTSMQAPQKISRKDIGAIGVDINADHLAVVETDRYGNPIARTSIPLCTYGSSRHQAKALIGDAAKSIIEWCVRTKKPVVLEKLTFGTKKSTLREEGNARYARMLSSFAYSSIISMIRARAYRFGIHVEEVNPAYTSIIGRVKFASRYGYSVHESAALCIGRRYLRVSERLPRHRSIIPDGTGTHVTLSLPVRNRDRHVWASWRNVQQKLQKRCLQHKSRRLRSDPQARKILACSDSTILNFVGEIPARESITKLLGDRV